MKPYGIRTHTRATSPGRVEDALERAAARWTLAKRHLRTVIMALHHADLTPEKRKRLRRQRSNAMRDVATHQREMERLVLHRVGLEHPAWAQEAHRRLEMSR